MTKRCHHELETKNGYPDDFICHKCQTIWTITDYEKCTAKELMLLPIGVRREILKRQAEKFNKDNPDFYKGNKAFG
jgi:hypothetical protein